VGREVAFKFERLKVWRRALELSMQVHEVTREFPKDEAYVLTSQMKRVADSAVLNIAEGSTGQSNAEFRQFLGYAPRSEIEVVACLYIGRERKVIQERDFRRLYDEVEEIVKMTQALRRSLR